MVSESETVSASTSLKGLPHGIIEAKSDLELKPSWSTSSLKSEFLQENFTIVLFHYDGMLDGWQDLEWSNNAIHVVAQNQTKWWFANRFLHPAVVSIYDYIFLWDEDLGVQHFNLRRYNIFADVYAIMEIQTTETLENSTSLLVTSRKTTETLEQLTPLVISHAQTIETSEPPLPPPLVTNMLESL
ncbi:hypothetical protein Lser_V15G10422 [Lactuca serriola]